MPTIVNGVPVVRRIVVPKIDLNGIPVIETTGYVETTNDVATVDYGINPCIWRALPTRGVVVWKVRHPVTATGATLPVIDNKSTQVLGHDVTVPSGTAAPAPQVQAGYTTEHWVYIDKCCGIFRLMGVTAINSPAEAAAPAENVQVASANKK